MRTIYKYILKKHCSKTYAEICWKDVPQTNANSITVCKPLLGSCFFSKCFVATYCLQLKWQEAWVVSRMHRKLPAKYARNFCFRTKNHKIRIWSHNNQKFFYKYDHIWQKQGLVWQENISQKLVRFSPNYIFTIKDHVSNQTKLLVPTFCMFYHLEPHVQHVRKINRTSDHTWRSCRMYMHVCVWHM